MKLVNKFIKSIDFYIKKGYIFYQYCIFYRYNKDEYYTKLDYKENYKGKTVDVKRYDV